MLRFLVYIYREILYIRIECDENETKIFERDLTCKFKKSKIYSKQEKSLMKSIYIFPIPK